jgi:hypothetical protein
MIIQTIPRNAAPQANPSQISEIAYKRLRVSRVKATNTPQITAALRNAPRPLKLLLSRASDRPKRWRKIARNVRNDIKRSMR